MEKRVMMRLRAAAVLWTACALLSVPALAEGMVIPVGEPVGIRVTVDGVLVAGISEVDTGAGMAAPARDAGIRAGDIIVSVNGQAVDSAAEVAELMAALGQEDAAVEYIRDGHSRACVVHPAAEPSGEARLGLWLRDGVTGIGTVTYIDPETGAFGALGHGVNDAESGSLLPVQGGSVCRAQIVSVRRGEPKSPGELAGSFAESEILGRIDENTERGIFGTMRPGAAGLREPVPVASPSEIEPGPATILACVSGHDAREYAVEIARTGLAWGDGRDLIVRVTDPELLALTGGIVQGMSGSPILQNGKLVGAVTHVLVSSPEQGYGIFAEHMLEAAKRAA